MKLLLAENRVEYFPTHRRPLAEAARAAGYDVHIATVTSGSSAGIVDAGFPFHQISRRVGGSRMSQEFAAMFGLRRVLRELRPDICHFITLRAVVHGLLALLLGGVRPQLVVCSITGLGFLFTDEELRARIGRTVAGNLIGILRRLVRPVFIFQNPDDRALFADRGWVPLSASCLVRGSGVDVRAFSKAELPSGTPIVLFCARYLRHKGIFEFVEAARLLRSEGVDARFVIVGDVDPHNPASASRSDVDAWLEEGIVEDWGFCSDVPARLAQAALVVLPSYREGLPKVVIEAAATGRPVIVSDSPGCREAVVDGQTGLLVPPKDPGALASAIGTLLADPARRRLMGDAARRDAESRFASDVIAEAIVGIYATGLPPSDERASGFRDAAYPSA
jgi:glycosyltransferase involved in cell wall biosynthesis